MMLDRIELNNNICELYYTELPNNFDIAIKQGEKQGIIGNTEYCIEIIAMNKQIPARTIVGIQYLSKIEENGFMKINIKLSDNLYKDDFLIACDISKGFIYNNNYLSDIIMNKDCVNKSSVNFGE